ncbi:hypothetical protein EVAR_57473_1 [Eumeta japonica]|uniref:Uncharacterized protein n=1 Tax=Eumeta variegata TaxID=151549 RepID=A0A4C1ZHA5_EUMVA|nr:hypothetical protein EVAR_57473_1 [Eumeta japonica]
MLLFLSHLGIYRIISYRSSQDDQLKRPHIDSSISLDGTPEVKSFFEEEARLQAPIIPFNQIYKRISAATGVSQGLISKNVKEGQAAEEVGTKIHTPGKQRI